MLRVCTQCQRVALRNVPIAGQTLPGRVMTGDLRRSGYPMVMTGESTVPRSVRAGALLVGLQGAAGVVVAIGLLVSGSTGLALMLATAVWFAGFGGILLAVAVSLARGRRSARTPAIVAQILLLGVSWYAAGPSAQPAYGVAAAVLCVAVLVLLCCPPAQQWTTGSD